MQLNENEPRTTETLAPSDTSVSYQLNPRKDGGWSRNWPNTTGNHSLQQSCSPFIPTQRSHVFVRNLQIDAVSNSHTKLLQSPR